jgi:hypothetical protein
MPSEKMPLGVVKLNVPGVENVIDPVRTDAPAKPNPKSDADPRENAGAIIKSHLN